MIIAVFINDEGSKVYMWDSDYLCEYSEEERAQYHTIVVFDEESDKKLYEKINGKELVSEE